MTVQNLITQPIISLLESKDMLADDITLKDIWQDFFDGYSYNLGKDDYMSSLVLHSIQTNIINKLNWANTYCMQLIDELIKIADTIMNRISTKSALTEFLVALAAALSIYTDQEPSRYLDYITTSFKTSNDSQNNMGNEHLIASQLDVANILSILVTHKLVCDGELEDFLDKQTNQLVTMTTPIVGDSHLGDSQVLTQVQKSGGVKDQSLSLTKFGANVDGLLRCINQLVLFGKNIFPTVPSEIKQFLYDESKIRNTNVFHQGRYSIDTLNQRVLLAIGQYIDAYAELELSDVMILFYKRIKQLKQASIKLPYLTSIDFAYLSIVLLMLNKLLLNGYERDVMLIQSELSSTFEIETHMKRLRTIDTKVPADLNVYQDMQDISKCAELRYFISGNTDDRSYRGTQGKQLTVTDLMDRLYSIKDIRFEEIQNFDATVQGVSNETSLNGSTDMGSFSTAIRSMNRNGTTTQRKTFMDIATKLHRSLNESLLKGDVNTIPVILESMSVIQSDYPDVVELASTGDKEVCNLIEIMNIDRSTYKNVSESVSISSLEERSAVLISNLKKSV